MSINQRIKFRQLQCFLEVARQGSVVKAADALGITQPAVSKTLKELEETLDVTLFDRTARGATLTPFGDVFLHHAGACISSLRQGVEGIAQVRSQSGGHVAIGALPTVAAGLVPRAVLAYKAQAPTTIVQILTGDTTTLLAALRVGDVDIVVGRLAEPDQMKGFSFEHLYTERVSFIVRPDHPLAKATGFPLARILDFTVIMPDEGSIIRPLVDRLLQSHGVSSANNRIESVSVAFGRSYVRSSDAIWIISRGAVGEDLASGALIELDVDSTQTRGPVGVTTRVGQFASVPVQLMTQAIRTAAAQA